MRLVIASLLLAVSVAAQKPTALRTVYQDKEGVVRWSDTRQELALFGANYCLPSASDYRAAGYVSTDRKKMVDQDMAHFARMGWDGLRLCLWGDFENTDSTGNLIANNHLDLLDYVIFKAKERGIYFLLSPIVTYSSQWPDAMHDTVSAKGFSTYFKKSELGTNPKAIAAQQNYIRQLLNHVNPYTGVALKHEPNILFIEMVNEPWHHSGDVEGSVRYINALVDAVRSTGCNKLVFHNYSQDFNMAKPLQQSGIQGVSFAWYPTGLNSNHTLAGNYLPVVDHYSAEMLRPEVSKLSKIVYEFDSPDLLTGYMYPAMVRSFREAGAQFAAMFSYDMLATAPYNLGWQTHYLNMVYTPKKAVSAIIAAEVMRGLPRLKNFGDYPANTSFGAFRVSYEQDLGEMNTDEQFLYSNTNSTAPRNITTLKKIAGYGSSPVVQYEGQGIYFLDKIGNGTWRLEVYPDAVTVKDPFNMPSPGKVVVRSISRSWPMTLSLPDLGNGFGVMPLNKGNTYNTKASAGTFSIRPGVYLLTRTGTIRKEQLPQTIGAVRMNEFVSPADQPLPPQVVAEHHAFYYAGKPIVIRANVYSQRDPGSVTLFLKAGAGRYLRVPMLKDSGYAYKAEIAAAHSQEGWIEYCIVVKDQVTTVNFPSCTSKSPEDWDYNEVTTWKSAVVREETPLRILAPGEDAGRVAFTRIGDGIRFGIYKIIPASNTGEPAFHLELPLNYDRNLRDYTISVPLKDKISARRDDLPKAKSLVLTARGVNQQQQAYITLVENDGTSWSKKIDLSQEWRTITIPLQDLELSKGAMLPLGYPGEWRYWFQPAEGRGGSGDRVRMENVEWIQLSIRQSDMKKEEAKAGSWIDIMSAVVQF